MVPCAGCSRFVRSEARRCPFCRTVQRDAPSPVGPAVAGVLLGLALATCGGTSTGDEGASTTMSGPGTSSTLGEETTIDSSEGEAVGTAYAGPDTDSSPFPDDTTDDLATSETTSTPTGTDTGTGTGTSGSGTSGSTGK